MNVVHCFCESLDFGMALSLCVCKCACRSISLSHSLRHCTCVARMYVCFERMRAYDKYMRYLCMAGCCCCCCSCPFTISPSIILAFFSIFILSFTMCRLNVRAYVCTSTQMCSFYLILLFVLIKYIFIYFLLQQSTPCTNSHASEFIIITRICVYDTLKIVTLATNSTMKAIAMQKCESESRWIRHTIHYSMYGNVYECVCRRHKVVKSQWWLLWWQRERNITLFIRGLNEAQTLAITMPAYMP